MTSEEFREDLRRRLDAFVTSAKEAYRKHVVDGVTSEMQRFIDQRTPEEDAILYRRRFGPDVDRDRIKRFTNIGHSSYIEGAFFDYPQKNVDECIAEYNAQLDGDHEHLKLKKFQQLTVNIETEKIKQYADKAAENAVEDLIEKLASKLTFLKGKDFQFSVDGVEFEEGVGKTTVAVTCVGYPAFGFKLQIRYTESKLGNPFVQAPLTFSGAAQSEAGIRAIYE